MLEKVRKPGRVHNVKAIVAYVLFALICFSFVFLGLVPNQGSFQSGGAAAYVNDTVISIAEFRERVDYYERQAGDRLKDLPAAQRQAETRSLRERALRELVEGQLRVQAARNAGLVAADAAVREQILNIPAFQTDGRFDRSRYDMYLQYIRSTATAFEDKVRADVVDNQLRQAFFKSLKNSEPLRNLERELRETKLNLEFVQVDAEKIKSASPSDKVARALLESEEGQKRINDYYNSHKGEFTRRAEVRARHILIKPKSDSQEAWDEALQQIQKYKADLESKDFADLAGEVSEDQGTKAKKGDLGYFGRGQMVKEFEDAAFTQPIGQVGEPVKTTYGYHLIKVEDRRGGDVQPLKEVELNIAKKVLAESAFEELVAELEKKLQAGESIDALLRGHNLKWEETGEFDLSTRFVPKLGDNTAVVDAALALKNKGETAKNLVRTNGQIFTVRLKSRTKPKLDSEDNFMSFAFSMGAIEALNNWMNTIREKAIVRTNDSLIQ